MISSYCHGSGPVLRFGGRSSSPVFHHPLSDLHPASGRGIMTAAILIEQTKTLDQVSQTTSQCHKMALKSVCFAIKQIKGFF